MSDAGTERGPDEQAFREECEELDRQREGARRIEANERTSTAFASRGSRSTDPEKMSIPEYAEWARRNDQRVEEGR